MIIYNDRLDQDILLGLQGYQDVTLHGLYTSNTYHPSDLHDGLQSKYSAGELCYI
jgi:hypothetical protein